ncbi:hypothetical protein [Aureimonas phyllosphaerae]|uniref:Uncharacterized protein n=1 Tax=Aureimonas phyllosphaerae TaxID=1166078 RepID=A0A7W6FW68_9HYPH|nr:hypothetical protein [Aureimonas phyllosphaerae]MBB3937908.1 hypothetical protein [Aureimonas phyllosphaerae]MBB3961919.1 hypothetical protein [Aureimonas phyllosphaerae]SFF54695.1 hypothetical protein SAMN05216566_12546 [Aureimonas phyllosphaerae]
MTDFRVEAHSGRVMLFKMKSAEDERDRHVATMTPGESVALGSGLIELAAIARTQSADKDQARRAQLSYDIADTETKLATLRRELSSMDGGSL